MVPHIRKLLVSGLLVAGLTATGQEVDQEEAKGGLAFVDEVHVTVVNIDVFVRDRQGNAVTGLAQNQFRLLQDGQERKLSHFAAYTDEVISEIMAAREAHPQAVFMAHPDIHVNNISNNPIPIIKEAFRIAVPFGDLNPFEK